MLASLGLAIPPELWRVGTSQNFWRLVASSTELRAFLFLLFPPLLLPFRPASPTSSGRISPLLARSVSSTSAATTTVSVTLAAATIPTALEPLAHLAPCGVSHTAPILEDRKLAARAAPGPAPAPGRLAIAPAARPRSANNAPPISRAVGRGAMIGSILPPEKVALLRKKKVAARPMGKKKIAAVPAFGASGRSAILPSILGSDENSPPAPKKTGLPRPNTKEIAVVRPPLARLSPAGPPPIEEYIDAVAAPSTISAPRRQG